jgi:hypothetical protein
MNCWKYPTEGSILSGGGKNGDNHRGGRRRFSKRRERENAQGAPQDSARGSRKNADYSRVGEVKLERKRGGFVERPRWKPPALSTEPIPTPVCPWCGKIIKDLSMAIADKTSGEPVHFDCVIDRISAGEKLESGDAVTYIGGGRFGVVHFNNLPDTRDFRIKKIFEWENKEERSEWRQSISDHFSVT